MPSCSIKECSARRSKNQPLLSVHRFPKSEILRLKWLEAIGTKNINARHKELYICSLHFEESQLNRTLDVPRLHDNAVPSLFLMSPDIIDEQVVTGMNSPREIVALDFETTNSIENSAEVKEHSTEVLHHLGHDYNIVNKPKIGQQLKKICAEQRKNIKRPNKKERREGKKKSSAQEIFFDLKEKNIINTEQSILEEPFSGPQKRPFKRQIAKNAKTIYRINKNEYSP